MNLPHSCKIIRLGNLSTNKHRPLKIICSTKDEASIFVSDFSITRNSKLYMPDNFKIVRDNTIHERQLLCSCYIELERHTEAGEANLSISYPNGVHTVKLSSSKTPVNNYLPPIKLNQSLHQVRTMFLVFIKTAKAFELN